MKYLILILTIVTYSRFSYCNKVLPHIDGIVNIDGMVVNQTCVIKYGDKHEEIAVSKHDNNDLDNSFNFNISLDECLIDIKKNINVVFSGLKDVNDLSAFKAGSSDNGIAIIITDINGNKITPDEYKHVILNKNKMYMHLQYESTQDDVVPSSTNSKFLIRVIYP